MSTEHDNNYTKWSVNINGLITDFTTFQYPDLTDAQIITYAQGAYAAFGDVVSVFKSVFTGTETDYTLDLTADPPVFT